MPMNMHAPQFKNEVSIGLIGTCLLTIATYLVVGAAAWQNITNQIAANQAQNVVWQTNSDKNSALFKTDSEARFSAYDARFAAIETKIAPLDSMIYRLTKAETDIINNNVTISARVDRISDSFGDRLEALRKDVNLLGTKVEVLTATIIDQNRRQSLQGKKPGD